MIGGAGESSVGVLGTEYSVLGESERLVSPISSREAGDFYEFCVADDGPGISTQYHDKIFVIFQTLKARDRFESTGVGLALVKKIVEDKGGSVYLQSEEGKGSAFYFTWPK